MAEVASLYVLAKELALYSQGNAPAGASSPQFKLARNLNFCVENDIFRNGFKCLTPWRFLNLTLKRRQKKFGTSGSTRRRRVFLPHHCGAVVRRFDGSQRWATCSRRSREGPTNSTSSIAHKSGTIWPS